MDRYDRYYVVYEFEKDGYGGRGATSGVLFTDGGPDSGDIQSVADKIKERYSYDKVMLLSWQKLSDPVDEDLLAQAVDND